MRVRVEHAAAHRRAGRLAGCGRARRPLRCRCGRDGAPRRARRCGCRRPGSTTRRRGAGSRARIRSSPLRSTEIERKPLVGRRGAVVVPDLGLAAGAPHSPRAIAHRDAVDVERLAVQREVAGDPARLVDVGTVVERRRLTREQRLAQRLEGEIERQVVVVAAEAEHAAGLEAAEPHAAVQVRGVEQVRWLGQRLVPAPLERGQLPRHRGRVVDHEHATELDAHVRPERRIEVPEQVALGHHPREPDGLRPPRVVGLGRVELVVLGHEPPVVGCVGHVVVSSWRSRTGVRWRSASAPIPERISSVSRAGLAQAVGEDRGGGQRTLLDRGADGLPRGLDGVERSPQQRTDLVELLPRELRPQSLRFSQVLQQPGDALGARSRRSRRRARGPRRRGGRRARRRTPSCSARRRRRTGSGAGNVDALGLGEQLGQQARVQRVVHQLPRDLAPAVTRPQPGEGADGGAELGEDPEVAEPGRVDRCPLARS